jgi:hypothetical protein
MLLNNIILRVLFDVSAAKLKIIVFSLDPNQTEGFNLKSSYSYSVNDEKFILHLNLELTEKF